MREEFAGRYAGTATAPAGNTSATEAASKPSIVLVHGAWADSGSWDAVVRRLQGMGYTVYAPPQHAHGTIHRTKAEADADEADRYAAATEA